MTVFIPIRKFFLNLASNLHRQNLNSKLSLPVRFPHKSQRGQGVVEFMLMISLVIFFLYFHVNLSIVYSAINYMDYASFMSARALQLGALTPKDQEDAAELYAASFRKRNPFGNFLKIREVKIGAKDKAIMERAPSKGGSASSGGGGNQKGNDGLIFADGKAIEGVIFKYEVPFFLVPLVGISSGEFLKGMRFLNLTSQAFFHREPTQLDCQLFWKDFAEKVKIHSLGENASEVFEGAKKGQLKNGDLFPLFDDGC